MPTTPVNNPTGSPFPTKPQPVPASSRVMNKLTLAWASVRSNKFFVAFEGGATGALTNYLQDAFTGTHKLDFSKNGLYKLGFFAASGGVTAVRLLYRPQPQPTVVATTKTGVINDVPATLVPQDISSVPVSKEATGDAR
jgi:hypothetical protein